MNKSTSLGEIGGWSFEHALHRINTTKRQSGDERNFSSLSFDLALLDCSNNEGVKRHTGAMYHITRSLLLLLTTTNTVQSLIAPELLLTLTYFDFLGS